MSKRIRIALAFAVIYLVWGSNYLAIHVAVREMPPLAFAALRCALAAPLLLGFARWQGQRLPTAWRDWWVVIATALLTLVLASGLVIWAQQWLPSGQAALIIASSALWVALFGALGSRGERLGACSVLGLLSGFAGVALLLAGSWRIAAVPAWAYAATLISALALAAGAMLLRRFAPRCGAALTAGLQSLLAAPVLGVASLAAGEIPQWRWTAAGAWALGYLVVFGSFIGYSVFNWLVHEVSLAQLGTYAYVNPAVAMLLGWLLLDERLLPTQALGAVVVIAGVALVMAGSRRRAQRR